MDGNDGTKRAPTIVQGGKKNKNPARTTRHETDLSDPSEAAAARTRTETNAAPAMAVDASVLESASRAIASARASGGGTLGPGSEKPFDAEGVLACLRAARQSPVGLSMPPHALGASSDLGLGAVARLVMDSGSSYPGVRERNDQDDVTFANLYLVGARRGDAASQHALAECYRRGRGVEQDFEKAIEWNVKAAAQGLEASVESLKWLYSNTIAGQRAQSEAAAAAAVASENENPFEAGKVGPVEDVPPPRIGVMSGL
jgi:hypothetical protein